MPARAYRCYVCVNVGYKHWSNDSNSNMQPITIRRKSRILPLHYFISVVYCRLNWIGRIMDSIVHWLHIYPLCEIFYFRAIDNWVMFKLTGLHYFRLFPSGLPYFVFMHAFIQSFHISTCKKKYAHWCKIVTFRAR